MKRLRLKTMTLIEVLIAMGVLVVCLTGILGAHVALFALADIARNSSIANNAAQFEMEKLKKESFDNLNNFNNTIFYVKYTSSAHTNVEIVDARPADESMLFGAGRIDMVDVTNYTKSNIKQVRIVMSFKSLKRVVGEDTNLDGTLSVGEDSNGSGQLDSPIEIVTLITR